MREIWKELIFLFNFEFCISIQKKTTFFVIFFQCYWYFSKKVRWINGLICVFCMGSANLIPIIQIDSNSLSFTMKDKMEDYYDFVKHDNFDLVEPQKNNLRESKEKLEKSCFFCFSIFHTDSFRSPQRYEPQIETLPKLVICCT